MCVASVRGAEVTEYGALGHDDGVHSVHQTSATSAAWMEGGGGGRGGGRKFLLCVGRGRKG